MSAAEFGTRVTGKTIYYKILGQPAGNEQYLPNQRSRWMDAAGNCVDGTWFERDGAICFDYPDIAGPQCYTVEHAGTQILAYKVGSEPLLGFLSFREDTEPLPCRAPNLGM